MRRLIFTEEEYEEIARFAAERGMNPKEALLAFVRFGNRAVDSGRAGGSPAEASEPTERLEETRPDEAES